MSKRPAITLEAPGRPPGARRRALDFLQRDRAPAAKDLVPGSAVDVKFDDGQDLGSGFFNPKSLIAVRLFARSLGVAPQPGIFRATSGARPGDAGAFYARPFYRLVHAEGDGLPGLVIDRFGDVLVLQITIAGMEAGA